MSCSDTPTPDRPRRFDTRRAVLLGLPAALAASVSGCGFSPVYGPGGQGSALQGAIEPDAPGDKNAFDFVAKFEERLGRAEAPRYRMRYEIQTRSEGVGITPAAETTRFNLFGGVTFWLVDLATGREVTQGFVETFTGYSATRLIVSTQSVERDARARLMGILADQVAARLLQTAPDWQA